MIELDANFGGFCADRDLEHTREGAVDRELSSSAGDWGPETTKARIRVLTSMTAP